MSCVLLLGVAGGARAQEESAEGGDEPSAPEARPEAGSAEEDATEDGGEVAAADGEGAAPADGEGAAPADGEGAAPAGSEEGGGEESATVEESSSPPPPPQAERARFKLRSAPGRAVRVSEIEERTAELSEMIEASEVRLKQLADRVLSGKIARAGSAIVYRNEMGTSFKLIRAVFALDGAPIFSQVDESGELGSREEIELFNGSIVPGEHRLSVSLEYRGHGFGIFSYLKGYRFKVRSSYSFTVQEGKLARVRVVGYEKGDQNTPLEERPDVRYVERVETFSSSTASSD